MNVIEAINARRSNRAFLPKPVEKEKLTAVLEGATHAAKSAIGRNITYIWGPPGTGKTKAIGKIIEELYRSGRTALIVSHTNTAVDQAILSVAKAYH